MLKNDLKFMQIFIDKRAVLFKILLTFLSAVELVLMIRGLIIFNLSKLKLVLYLCSYIFLFISSFAALLVLMLCKDRNKHTKKLTATVYIYSFCIIIWSAVITCIDCYAEGDSGIMVYVMTCISVSALIFIKPALFAAYMSMSGAFLVFVTALMRDWNFYSSGFYINFVIFLILAFFINIHSYSLAKSEYISREKLERLSYIDQLTDVSNRRGFDEGLASFLKMGKPFVLSLIDVDNLKTINDTYGHPVGDNCLVSLANVLKEYFGENVYRFGGDEFAVLSVKDATSIFLDIDAINQNIKLKEDDIQIYISAGIYSADGKLKPTEMVKAADEALYRAKSMGKAKWVVCE